MTDVPIRFVDEEIRTFKGEEAARRLAETSDVARFEEGRGVTRVDPERWATAQRYERKTWLERRFFSADDRNLDHRARFDGYACLRGRRFARGIELGCGPFTNMRYLLEVAEIDEVHLLDPLIDDYLTHPGCWYGGSRLGGLLSLPVLCDLRGALDPRVRLRAAANAARIGGFMGRPVTLHALAIEAFRPERPYDLVAMINVIEHCRDLDAIFERLDAMLAPGGVFVFHDKFLASETLRRYVERTYDAGHPLRVDPRVVEAFLAERFEVLYRLDRAQGETRSLHFIGARRTGWAPP